VYRDTEALLLNTERTICWQSECMGWRGCLSDDTVFQMTV